MTISAMSLANSREKRALEIVAAGGHNLLLMGPPGTGKTMLASRLPGLLPPLSNREALESAAILSLVNAHYVTRQWRRRPFSRPSPQRFANGDGRRRLNPLPRGDLPAHNGILFLDELPEFERRVLDALREPIESGKKFIFPALGLRLTILRDFS